MSPVRRVITSLHAALGRWLADPPAAKRNESEVEAWDRAHFEIDGRLLP